MELTHQFREFELLPQDRLVAISAGHHSDLGDVANARLIVALARKHPDLVSKAVMAISNGLFTFFAGTFYGNLRENRNYFPTYAAVQNYVKRGGHDNATR